jgi:hypothetical protein
VSARIDPQALPCVADDDDDYETQKAFHHQITRNTDASLLFVPWLIATVGVRVMCRSLPSTHRRGRVSGSLDDSLGGWANSKRYFNLTKHNIERQPKKPHQEPTR